MNKYNIMLSAVVISTMLVSATLIAAPPLTISSIKLPQIFNSAYGDSVTFNFVTETLPNGQPAYRLDDSSVATIPGPTLVFEEGDTVTINGVDDDFSVMDQTDTDGSPSTYTFTASTPGTYVYKDESSALIGLFGAVIVNAADGSAGSYVDSDSGTIEAVDVSELDGEFVMFMVGSTFWVSELSGGSETPLWTNPMISAVEGDLVRFHVLSVGPGHTFHLHAHRWVDPGTTNIIDTKLMEADEDSHFFIVKAGDAVGPGHWQYHCHVFAHMEAGMHGIFNVVETGPAISEAGASPYNGILTGGGPGLVTFEISDEPGSWFRSTRGDALVSLGTVTKSLELARPGDSVHFIMSDTNTVHTITSLLWPTGAPHMPMDEVTSYKGGGIVQLEDPGLYVFTCKVHPYMFGGVIVDDPATNAPDAPLGVRLDLGEQITLVNGATIPTGSDLALRLLKTFFVATAPVNWRDYSEDTWNPSYPPVAVLAAAQLDEDPELDPLPVDNLDALLEAYFSEGSDEVKNNADLLTPDVDGIGQVWVDTQFEKTEDKTKPGTATAVDVDNWAVARKVALDMNNPHNMWTDQSQSVIYQTEWFDNKLTIFDRDSGAQIGESIPVGEAPSHVMTRPDTYDIHVALNGEDGVAEILAGDDQVNRIIRMQGYGQNPTHPHAHWMSAEGDKMVTPNSFTHDTTLYGFDDEEILAKPATGVLAIATGMMPDSSKYYVANLLSSTISVIDMDSGEKIKDINLAADYNAVPLAGINEGLVGPVVSDNDGDDKILVAALPIQTPVSPDGKVMVTANTLTGNLAIIDTTTDTMVATLPCDPGCHGVQWGAKAGGGYYAYASSKFANVMLVVDPGYEDGTDNLNLDNAEIVGRILLADDSAPSDKEITDLGGFGGQGVLPVPVVYNGWVQDLSEDWTDLLTCEQRTPIDEEAIASCNGE